MKTLTEHLLLLISVLSNVQFQWRLVISKTILLFLTLITNSHPIYAADDAQKDAVPQYAIVDWFPFGWVDQGQTKGLFVEIAAALDKATYVKSVKTVMAVPRVHRAVDTGEADFTFSYRDDKLLKKVDFIANIGCWRVSVVSKADNPVSQLKDLNGMRFAYPSTGYFAIYYLPDLQVKGMAISQSTLMFRMFLNGRLDAFTINDAVWKAFRHDLYPGFAVPKERWLEFAAPFHLPTLPVAVSISKKSKFKPAAKRIAAYAQSTAFLSELKKIYVKYHIPEAADCLVSTTLP